MKLSERHVEQIKAAIEAVNGCGEFAISIGGLILDIKTSTRILQEEAYNPKGIRLLLMAVIDRAIKDMRGIGPSWNKSVKESAAVFIHSEDYEDYCLELGIDYNAILKLKPPQRG